MGLNSRWRIMRPKQALSWARTYFTIIVTVNNAYTNLVASFLLLKGEFICSLPVTAKLFSIIIFYYFYLNCPATQYHYSQSSNCLYFSKRSKRKFAVNRLHFPVGGSLNLYDKFCLLHSSESIYL